MFQSSLIKCWDTGVMVDGCRLLGGFFLPDVQQVGVQVEAVREA